MPQHLLTICHFAHVFPLSSPPAPASLTLFYQYKDQQEGDHPQQLSLSWPSLENIALTIRHTLGVHKDDRRSLPTCFERLTGMITSYVYGHHTSLCPTGYKHLADVLAKIDPSILNEEQPLACKKACYNYLLLDPTKLQPQPIGEVQHLDNFIESIFYVGFGEAMKATNHLTESEVS